MRLKISALTAVLSGVLSVSAAGAQSPVASGPPPSSDPCLGVTSGKAVVPMASRHEPGLYQTYKSVYGATVERITDVKAWNKGADGVIVPMYSTVPAWNVNESYLILFESAGKVGSLVPSGWLLFNGMNYKYIRRLPIQPADDEDVYWSPVDPDLLYYMTDENLNGFGFAPALVQFSVSHDKSTILHKFNHLPLTWQQVDFGHVLYLSWNNRKKQLIAGIREQDQGTSVIYTESYNITTGRSGGWKKYTSPDDFMGLQIAPSGTLGMVGDDVVNPVTQQILHKMKTDSTEHGDFAVLANGDDAWVSSQYGSDTFPHVPVGNMIVEDLRTGRVKTVIGTANGWPYPPSTSHISALAFKNPGWVAESIVGDPSGQGVLDSTILVANINTGEVCRLAHTHSNGDKPGYSVSPGPQGYYAEPHAVISPSGTRILFASDWGGTADVDTFVVTLPAFHKVQF